MMSVDLGISQMQCKSINKLHRKAFEFEAGMCWVEGTEE